MHGTRREKVTEQSTFKLVWYYGRGGKIEIDLKAKTLSHAKTEAVRRWNERLAAHDPDDVFAWPGNPQLVRKTYFRGIDWEKK